VEKMMIAIDAQRVTAAGHSGPACRGDIEVSLLFIRRQMGKPVMFSAAYTGGEPEELFAVDPHRVTVHDMRALAPVSVDRQGFALRNWPVDGFDLHDDGVVRSAYFQAMAARLRDELGAKEVHFFDATRRSDAASGAANSDGARGTASRVHVDYTASSGPQRAREVVGTGRFDDLMAAGRRIVQLNVWRPINGPVRRSPLALADASTVRARDLVATDQIYPDRTGEIYHLAYDAAQLWYHAPGMTPDEVLLIKGWDSNPYPVARFTPHAAFELPDHAVNARVRESIEARAILVI
jgi:hypothetical protein